jgi:transposase
MQASPVGQRVIDYTGAAALMNDLPEAKWLLADRGYDADWFREALQSWAKVSQENRRI